MASAKGCLLVGSVCMPETEAVFRQCSKAMPNRLKRIPDGETGDRQQFTVWQAAFFQSVPEMMTQFVNNAALAMKEHTPDQVAAGIEKLRQAKPETHYDDRAIESYAVFKKLRDEGVIPKGTRFQVCLPGLGSVVMVFVQQAFQAAVESVYEAALFRAMRNMQEAIPHEDLAIQIDIAGDMAILENLDFYKPWFFRGDDEMEKRKRYVVDYFVRMMAQVDKDVELGIHNCYGDMEHRHWKEPESLATVTELGLALFDRSPHHINYFHLPVPKSAMGKLEAYYEPLKKLFPKFKEHGTDLYLGLVHADDLEGTQKRIDVAKKVFGEDLDFGVGTECGWGRTPPEDIESIMQISTEVCRPVF